MVTWKGVKTNATDILSPFFQSDVTIKKYVVLNTFAGTNNITIKIIRGTVEASVCTVQLDEGDYIVEDDGIEVLLNDKIKVISTQTLDYNFSMA